MTDAATGTAAYAPIDLTILKDDLGIAAGDTSNDAWLQRRADAVWASMEAYTMRRLCSPPATFSDDWGQITVNGAHMNLPPTIAWWPRTTVFLRVFPVTAITGLKLGTTTSDPTKVVFDQTNGKILSLDGTVASVGWDAYADLSSGLLSQAARVTYSAGWATVPLDLYEIVLGVLQVQWGSRQAQQSGLGSGAVTQIDVQDVGNVQFASANPFIEGAIKAGASPDPLLGPYTATLDRYVDWRQALGLDCLPTTRPGP